MRRLILLLTTVLGAVNMFAQLNGDGYYRVQNQKTERYMTIIDNRGKVNAQTTDADFGALRTVMGFERIVSDPASILYIKKLTTGYDILCQGTGSYEIIGYELNMLDLRNGTYAAYATTKGMTKYLSDAIPNWMMDEDEKIYGSVGTNSDESRLWYIKPVVDQAEHYFGIRPDIALADGYYKSFYASFPFSFLSSGMTAYYVSMVDNTRGYAIVKPIGGNIPAGTPVIVKCSSDKPENNKLNLLNTTVNALSGNLLKGVYFCNPNAGTHTNVVDYQAQTMRVLGKAADGSLAFVKQAGLQYIPANTAYLTVSSTAPAEFKVMTENEYQQMLAEEVTITAKNYTRVYGESNPSFDYDTKGAELKGEPVVSCTASETSPVGTYAIKVSQGSLTNSCVNLIDGVLTIVPAELTVSVSDASRKVGEENPEFVLNYEGFKNGETESVLTAQPVASTIATKDSPAGVYDITIAGGSANNYVFNYVGGKLTVMEGTIIAAKNYTRVYGDANPEFEYESQGETLEGVPTLLCDADAKSPVGQYVIKVGQGSVANEYLSLVDGVLTITPAELTVTVADASRDEGKENPEFVLSYEGFKNGETESVLTAKPVVSTTATADSPAGVYDITVSGGSAENYVFKYVGGKLTVNAVIQDVVDLMSVDKAYDVYDVYGKLIMKNAKSLLGLRKGIYVVNGRKVIVK